MPISRRSNPSLDTALRLQKLLGLMIKLIVAWGQGYGHHVLVAIMLATVPHEGLIEAQN